MEYYSAVQRMKIFHLQQTVETMSDFIFLGSKTTADGDCSHEIKRHLLYLCIKKQRH